MTLARFHCSGVIGTLGYIRARCLYLQFRMWRPPGLLGAGEGWGMSLLLPETGEIKDKYKMFL